MNNFNQNRGDKRTGQDRDRGERAEGRRFDRRNEGRSEMFPATCDQCGNSCQVPFRPTQGKPVYCSNCFETKGGRGRDNFKRRDFARGGYQDRDSGRSRMHQAVCDECGKNCEVPFRPTPGKPIFCSNCFEDKEKGKSRLGRSEGIENYAKLKDQFDILNVKLDKILSCLKSSEIEEIKEVKPKRSAKRTAAKTKKSETKNEDKTIIEDQK